ncbi:MAG: tRNA guanosine(34) transglycosylase Tgt [Rickettsiales bacterium]|nr:tRNA guanosine(34) transglycosylase Tgt [Rickettsiales bacterium]|tara:strand:+ start:2742 stop:3941 length:1200 start_codon:yes stop_codon:yes gene_type:complete
MSNFSWKINYFSKKSRARSGCISTPHGKIYTPAFIFCATKGALKSITTSEAKKQNTQIILSNTYHLMLQPGSKLISEQGGLHNFINWDGPMLTDSGGFQIFSLGHGSVSNEIKGKRDENQRIKSLLKIDEEGAIFKSYIDGKNHLLTPEKSIKIQRQLGADLIVVLDECTPFNVDKSYTSLAMHRSHRWSRRSVNYFNSKLDYNSNCGSSGKQSIYGIVQGGVYEDLREESINYNLNKIEVFGIAIGGSLGSNKAEMHNVVNFTSNKLGTNHPIHLLGIGDPNDIWKLVKSGIDTFDCVSPTRLARHGGALIRGKNGKININNSQYKNDLNPIESDCLCETCKNYNRSYLHHLFKSNELIGLHLLTLHNMFFMNNLMSIIRTSIKKDALEDAEKKWFED